MHRNKDSEFMAMFKKNRALVTGLVSVGLVVFFVTSVLISGQTLNLSKSDQSLAAGGSLGNVTARCLDPGTIEMKWDAHSGADHYAIEGFKEYSGAGPRVFGFVAAKGTTYIAHDPDFAGNRITMDLYAQDANGRNIAGPAFAPQVTCPSSPLSSASITRVTCDTPGKMNLSWDAHTGADHYVIEVFSKGIGGAGGGSRVAGFYATPETSYVVNDPDLAGGTFTADIYAQDAMNQNIFGPVFADTVTCPGSAPSAGAWKINMQAVCASGTIPSKMQGSVNARWRPYPYQPNGQIVGYENGGAMSSTGLVQIDAPVIKQDLNWFSYLSYRYPNNTFVQTLKSYGAMPNSHFEAHDYTPDNLRYQVTWDEQTPAGTYNLKFTLPADAPECAAPPASSGAWKVNMQAVCADGSIPSKMQGSVNARWRPYPYQPNGQIVGYENGGAMSSTGLVQIDAPVINQDLNWFSYLSYRYPNNTFVQTLKSYGAMPNSHFEAHDYTPDNLRYQVTWDEQTPVGTYDLKFTLPADAPECGSTTIPPVACTNKDLMMVLDTSGSMSGQRVRDAQAAIQALVAKLPSGAGARAGVVGFGTHAYSVSDMTETMSKVSGSVGKLKATGGTNLAEGISLGTSKLAVDNRTHVMLILTDGLANLPRARDFGPNDPEAYASAQAGATAAVQANLEKGLKTVFYSVGLGKRDNLNSTWLDTLTAGTGGRSAYTSKSGDLDNLFASLTSDICKETPSNASPNFLNKLQGITAPNQ